MGPTEVSESERRRVHWDAAYERVTPTGASWFQCEPTLSLELMHALGLSPDAPIIDIGGGASTLADALVERGFVDVTVLDVSLTALDAARDRLGERADRVQWLREDLLEWEPPRRYAVWHDRAVFHFLVDPSDRERYASTLRAAMAPGGSAVIATFAPDGPEQCSGLPVSRYGPEELSAALGSLRIAETRREEHVTPAGVVQPFTWVVVR